ncbi:unnamed protein product [Rotaria sp. Silwood2]|nr:unnamed protein product [Rotaria sp. Silwood2]CAF2649921.1 unnamed protein product [Rotaria sp. Silwood2]CAF2906111.1 unnamed protein product [Rotaria sp. Silwood2]CAF3070936.1 unnamed protein product [Rotaria sp. Silwood2]
MLVRSSFRDTISKVKKQFQQDENSSKDKIHLIKYDSIDNIFIENNQKYSSKRIYYPKDTISNGKLILTRQYSRYSSGEKTRNLLVNVFRTRRSNVALGSNETNMVGKQFSVSVINLATSIGSNRISNTTPINNESALLNLLDQRKHALSEENLPSTVNAYREGQMTDICMCCLSRQKIDRNKRGFHLMWWEILMQIEYSRYDGSYIYFTNVKGQNFKERLNYSSTSENTTLREILLKLFEKHHLTIETCNICLRSAPSLPLSLDQPVKHLLLDDLVVTGT